MPPVTFKFPRKFSKAYCLDTSCKKMGFTQKASCRPYKNCYKGGSKKASNAEKKFIYHSEHTTFNSHPSNNKSIGKKTIVNIENGKGTKSIISMDHKGNIIKTNSEPLKKGEIDEIVKGNYVNNLWKTPGLTIL